MASAKNIWEGWRNECLCFLYLTLIPNKSFYYAGAVVWFMPLFSEAVLSCITGGHPTVGLNLYEPEIIYNYFFDYSLIDHHTLLGELNDKVIEVVLNQQKAGHPTVGLNLYEPEIIYNYLFDYSLIDHHPLLGELNDKVLDVVLNQQKAGDQILLDDVIDNILVTEGVPQPREPGILAKLVHEIFLEIFYETLEEVADWELIEIFDEEFMTMSDEEMASMSGEELLARSDERMMNLSDDEMLDLFIKYLQKQPAEEEEEPVDPQINKQEEEFVTFVFFFSVLTCLTMATFLLEW
jgi:hypothetical protein